MLLTTSSCASQGKLSPAPRQRRTARRSADLAPIGGAGRPEQCSNSEAILQFRIIDLAVCVARDLRGLQQGKGGQGNPVVHGQFSETGLQRSFRLSFMDDGDLVAEVDTGDGADRK